jgi:DNA-binding transcriptional ArsR family regulator
MAMQDKPGIREDMVVDDPETMKLILGGKCNDILELVQSREMSVSEIARTLKINPGSAHYHLKELEKHGLAKVVGEETKGNIVKKYYRASARNIYLDGSRFKAPGTEGAGPMEEYYDSLLKLMGAFGYDIPAEKSGPVKNAMLRYNRRKKELMRQIQDAGVENIESNRLLVGDAYYIARLFRETEDPELVGIREELRALLAGIREQG